MEVTELEGDTAQATRHAIVKDGHDHEHDGNDEDFSEIDVDGIN